MHDLSWAPIPLSPAGPFALTPDGPRCCTCGESPERGKLWTCPDCGESGYLMVWPCGHVVGAPPAHRAALEHPPVLPGL